MLTAFLPAEFPRLIARDQVRWVEQAPTSPCIWRRGTESFKVPTFASRVRHCDIDASVVCTTDVTNTRVYFSVLSSKGAHLCCPEITAEGSGGLALRRRNSESADLWVLYAPRLPQLPQG